MLLLSAVCRRSAGSAARAPRADAIVNASGRTSGDVGRAVAGERGAGRHDPRCHAHRRARRSSRSSRIGRRVRRGAERARPTRRPPRRRRRPYAVAKAAASRAGERGCRVGPGHGRCPRFQSDRSRDAPDVLAGTGRAAASGCGGRWRAVDRARPPGCRPRLHRPPGRLDGRAWSWRPADAWLTGSTTSGAAARRRQGPGGHDRGSSRILRRDPRVAEASPRSHGVDRQVAEIDAHPFHGMDAGVGLADSVDALVTGVADRSPR